MGDRHAKLDVAFDFPCVKGGVEGPEFDRTLLEHAV